MRVKLPEFRDRKQLFEFLATNKKQLIAQKKSTPIVSDPFTCLPSILDTPTHSETAVKRIKDQFPGVGDETVKTLMSLNASLPDGVLRVKVVANSANFVDSHLDVLLPDAPLKSIRERKGLIPHLHDHEHLTTAEVGDVQDILLMDVPIKDLGYNASGTTQAVVFITDIREDYNAKIYERYKNGRSKQHSIGLQYMKIELAIDDDDYLKEKEFFDKYYDQIINKEVVDNFGYFWVISEYKLIENSVVLFGSNAYTPTLEIEANKQEPEASTPKEPQKSTQDKELAEALNRLNHKIKKLS